MAAPEICPVCGAKIPANAKACPECGSDEQTGWSEEARYDSLDLPDEDFDYEEFVKNEFGGGSAKPRNIHWFWWVVAIALIAGLLLLFIR